MAIIDLTINSNSIAHNILRMEPQESTDVMEAINSLMKIMGIDCSAVSMISNSPEIIDVCKAVKYFARNTEHLMGVVVIDIMHTVDDVMVSIGANINELSPESDCLDEDSEANNIHEYRFQYSMKIGLDDKEVETNISILHSRYQLEKIKNPKLKFKAGMFTDIPILTEHLEEKVSPFPLQRNLDKFDRLISQFYLNW